MKKNMKRMVVLFTVLVWMIPVMVTSAFAEGNASIDVMEVGNKLCPVSDDAVSGKDFVAYQGKSYGLCCPKCRGAFLNDPEKYIAQMGAGEKRASSTVI